MKFLCKLVGGSRLYNLALPNSDFDYRGVFVNTSLEHVLGLEKGAHFKDTSKEDAFYYEFRHFLNLLKKTNTQVMELLFADENAFTELTDEFQLVRENRYQLVDSEKLFKSLSGYLHGEMRLMLGERTGKLGGKRKSALDKYGYSYKNYVQMRRLCEVGRVFFESGKYVVSLNGAFQEELMNVKTYPETLSKSEAKTKVEEHWEKLKLAYDSSNVSLQFNSRLANELVLKAYKPVLESFY